MKRDGNSQLARVLAALREGGGTAHELSAETGLPVKHCSAHLCELVRTGLAVKAGAVAHEKCPECGNKPSGSRRTIYQAVEQRADS
jgi:hypothetical protein